MNNVGLGKFEISRPLTIVPSPSPINNGRNKLTPTASNAELAQATNKNRVKRHERNR